MLQLPVPSVTIPRRWALALALAALAGLVLLPGLALAHGVVVKAEPAPFAILDNPPATVTIWANEPVGRLSSLRVLDAQGQRVDARGTRVDPNNRRLEVDLIPVAEGRYTVLWTLNSLVDGHTTQGSYVFAVGGSGTTPLEGLPPPPPGKAAPPVLTGSVWTSGQAVQSLALWVVLLAVLLLLGASVFRLLVPRLLAGATRATWAGLAERATLRWAPAQRLLLVSLAASTIVATLAMGAGAGQSWAKAASPPFVWELLSSTPFGLATMAKVLIAVLLLVAGLLLRRLGTGVVLVGSLVYLALVAYTGHAAAVTQPLRIAVLLDWLHLVAASTWLGGMAFAAVALLPAREKGKSRRVGTNWRQLIEVLSGFSPIALASVAVLVATGAYNSLTRLSGPGDLLSTGFGRVLVAKAVLVAAMMALSFANAFLVRPRLRAALDAQPTRQPPQADRLRRLLRWEPLVGVAVIAATALLSAYPPPGLGRGLAAIADEVEALAGEPRFAIAQRSGDLLLVLRMGPGDVGRNSFEVELSNAADGNLIEGPVKVTASAALVDRESAGQSIPMEREPDGHHGGEGNFAFEGLWRLDVTVVREGGPEVTSTFQFPLPVNDATALLARAQQAMNSLSSLRIDDTLDNGAGVVIESTTEFQAPGRMYLKTNEGREIYIIGEARYLRQPGGPWQVGKGPEGQPFKFPDFNFREGYLQPVIVGAERIGVQPHSIVAAYDSRAQLYYLKWIGADDNLVRRWLHIGPGHFLDSRFTDFNSRSISISPPNTSGP